MPHVRALANGYSNLRTDTAGELSRTCKDCDESHELARNDGNATEAKSIKIGLPIQIAWHPTRGERRDYITMRP